MYTTNNQKIYEEIYDENYQPTDEELLDYARFLGIDPDDEPELMWIAKQGVMAPLPAGWKPVEDPQGELYYFNFATGESIWDHPCDQFYQKLVLDERKILLEKGKESYKASKPEIRDSLGSKNHRTSPNNTLKNSDKFANGLTNTAKSTSTISDLINGNNKNGLKNNLRNDFPNYDKKEIDNFNVQYEEEKDGNSRDEDDDEEEEDEEEASWQKKSGSESSDGFHKPVDFGIEKEVSLKLDRLHLKLTVEKDKDSNVNGNRFSVDSAPTTSRDVLESPTRPFNKHHFPEEPKKSVIFSDSVTRQEYKNEEKSRSSKTDASFQQKDIKSLEDSLKKEYDQKRLELLEEKEKKMKSLRGEIEQEINNAKEDERKKMNKEHANKIAEMKDKMQRELEKEQDALRKRHTEAVTQIEKEFEREKQIKKEKFSMQISKFMKSEKSFDELDEGEEKRELAVYFEHLERKYGERLDDKKKEMQRNFEKKMRELEDELKRLHEEEVEKKESEIRLQKEKNLRLESLDQEMEKLLNEKMKEFREKEAEKCEQIKREFEIKVRTFKDEYKHLEEKEFNNLKSEFNKKKDEMHTEYEAKSKELENELRVGYDRLKTEEQDLQKRIEIVDERRRNLDADWNKLNDEQKKIDEKKSDQLKSKLSSGLSANETETDLTKLKVEIGKLKLEKTDLQIKLNKMQEIMDKYYSASNHLNQKSAKLSAAAANESNDGESASDTSEALVDKINSLDQNLNELSNENDDNEMKELIKHAKLKVKLKYYSARKKAEMNSSNELESSDDDDDFDEDHENDDEEMSYLSSDQQSLNNELKLFRVKSSNDEDLIKEVNENRKFLIESISREKDSLQVANELLDRHRKMLIKRKLLIDSAKNELDNEEVNSADKKTTRGFNERKLLLEKEALDLQQLGVSIQSGKRLIKQKRTHLDKLESSIFGLVSSNQDRTESDVSIENSVLIRHLDGSSISRNAAYFDLNNNDEKNLSELIVKLKEILANNVADGTSDLGRKRLNTLLRTLPKLDGKIRRTLGELASRGKTKRVEASVENSKVLGFIDEKWQKYLSSNSSGNFFNKSNVSFSNEPLGEMLNKPTGGHWENTPAYHRLMYESGSRMLDQKWNQYIGGDFVRNFDSTSSKTLRNTQFLNRFDSGSNNFMSNSFVNSSQSLLPASTQHRIKRHQDWLKKFKADSEFNSGTTFNLNNL